MNLDRLLSIGQALRERSPKPTNVVKDGRTWFRITNQDGFTEVYLYDMIGEWGVTAQEFVNQLRGITGPIHLHVNCEGGEVFDGIAIYGAIARHPAPVTAHVDSLAASAASFIVQAAGHRLMARNARMLIHDARGLAYGTPADLREIADLYDDASDNIASIYVDRAGGTVAQWREAMQAGLDGTWYGAQAAVDAGLVDEVAPVPRANAGNQDSFARTVNRINLDVDEPPAPAPEWVWDPAEFAQVMREAEQPPLTMPDVLPWQAQPDPNDPERRPA